nr:unnamed protein product [uncultured bacterium]
MSFFSDLIKSANPISWIGDAIGGVGSLIAGNKANKSAAHLADKQIAAQREANQANIASQERINAANVAMQRDINQQNVDLTRELNSIMRRDNQNAISDKRADLMRAGYSTADPSMQGFSAASLISPDLGSVTQSAAMVQPEFTPSMASTLIQSKNSTIDNVSKIVNTLSQFDLARANAKKTNLDSKLLSAQMNTLIDTANQNLKNLQEQGRLTTKQVDLASQEFLNLGLSFQALAETVKQEQFKTSKQQELFTQTIDNMSRQAEAWTSETDLNKARKDILELQKRYESVVADLAEKGVDFKASDPFSAILKILLSPDSEKIFPTIVDNLKSIIKTGIEALNPFKD